MEDFCDLFLQTIMWVLTRNVLENKSWGHFIIRSFAADYSWWLNQAAGCESAGCERTIRKSGKKIGRDMTSGVDGIPYAIYLK